jgi:uncharacterized Tic20 family protein
MTEAQDSGKFCSNCGAKINSKALICPSCGVRQAAAAEDVSSLWYLVPLFFGFIGGIVAWAVNKDRDPKKARKMMIFGILWTVLIVVLSFLFALLMAWSMQSQYGGY